MSTLLAAGSSTMLLSWIGDGINVELDFAIVSLWAGD